MKCDDDTFRRCTSFLLFTYVGTAFSDLLCNFRT